MNLRIGVLTVSDRVAAGQMQDEGGPAIEAALQHPGWVIGHRGIVPDEIHQIAGALTRWADEDGLDVVLTTGGTGLAPRDVTPEATSRVCDRLVPGIAEAIRIASLQQTPQAMISRALAGARGTTLIVNLPGSPRGAAQGAEVVRPILEHAVSILHGGKH